MEENDHQKNLNELEKMSDFLKGVVDFGKKFESISQTKPKEIKIGNGNIFLSKSEKEDKPQVTHSSPWVSAKDTEGLKDGVEYFVRLFNAFRHPIYSTAFWYESSKSFYLKNDCPFPVKVEDWMEIPE